MVVYKTLTPVDAIKCIASGKTVYYSEQRAGPWYTIKDGTIPPCFSLDDSLHNLYWREKVVQYITIEPEDLMHRLLGGYHIECRRVNSYMSGWDQVWIHVEGSYRTLRRYNADGEDIAVGFNMNTAMFHMEWRMRVDNS